MMSKLTISFIFVLGLALVAGPVSAQTVHLGTATGENDEPLADGEFLVFEMPASVGSAANGMIYRDDITIETPSRPFPNLVELFEFGGTIELWMIVDDDPSDSEGPSAEDAAEMTEKLIISEIMWGVDLSAPRTVDGVTVMPAGLQWIEIYNGSGETKGGTTGTKGALYLYFHENERLNRLGTLSIFDANINDTVGDSGDFTVVIVDRISTVGRFGRQWELKGSSGRIVPDNTRGVSASNMVSMYRKGATKDGKYALITEGDNKGNIKDLKDGAESDAWEVSKGRTNMSGRFIGTPGAVHVGIGGVTLYERSPDELLATGVIINEVRNSSDDRLDWIELHNTSDRPVQVENWEITFVTAVGEEPDGVVLPKSEIPAGSYLLLVNTDPSETFLARGVPAGVKEDDFLRQGSKHLYHADNKLVMPNDKKFMIVLRNDSDANKNSEKVEDVVGATFGNSDTHGTEVWPLMGWGVPDDPEDFGNPSFGGNKAWARNKSEENRFHEAHWDEVGYKGGVGYDPNAKLDTAIGTPGYPNEVTERRVDIEDGGVIISEIMFDAGEDGRLVQWIELYNSSTASAVNIGGWTLDIRNRDGVVFFVNAGFEFAAGTTILPNQTLLIVSHAAPNNVPERRIYNLWHKHRDVLALLQRRSILLSREGFYLRLTDKDDSVVDEAGNIAVVGGRRNKRWDLPETDGEVRRSLVRKGADGTAEDAWVITDSNTTYYGHRRDVGTPGTRLGSPLPVSLSSFRPVRDSATGQVVITWITESELNNAGFNILRSESRDGDFQKVNVKLIAGHGTTSERHIYTYTDTTARSNVVYYYRIEDVSFAGKRTTLRTTHLRRNVAVVGKLTMMWGDLKLGR